MVWFNLESYTNGSGNESVEFDTQGNTVLEAAYMKPVT